MYYFSIFIRISHYIWGENSILRSSHEQRKTLSKAIDLVVCNQGSVKLYRIFFFTHVEKLSIFYNGIEVRLKRRSCKGHRIFSMVIWVMYLSKNMKKESTVK